MSDSSERPTHEATSIVTELDAWFRVLRVDFTSHDGDDVSEKSHLVVDRGDSVAIVPVLAGTQDVVLVEQFRVATTLAPRKLVNPSDGYLLEAVAGGPERLGRAQGDRAPRLESYANAVRRELVEETGLEVVEGTLQHVGWYWSSPGVLTEQVHVFIADAVAAGERGPRSGDRAGHEGEGEATFLRRMPLDILLQSAIEGELRDPKMLVAAMAYIGKRLGGRAPTGESGPSKEGAVVYEAVPGSNPTKPAKS